MYLIPATLRSVGSIQGSRVLDVGCGVGVLVSFLEAEGVAAANVTGVDVAGQMLASARVRHPAATFWQGDVIDFPMVGRQGPLGV
jgi:2-polyprenyl-3-methyl-5-hydroxy-6-metoxy-1,4-benzoquinol methylase